jgi:recombination protein RecA
MPVPAPDLNALRHALDTVVERERPRDEPSLATGLGELDALLGGGLPRGRLSELQAPRGQGRTTLLRAMVAHTLATGRWVAIVDAQRTLAPADWARLASPPTAGPGAIGTTPAPALSAVRPDQQDTSRLAVIRPLDPAKAPWCADVLLRSGAYALVVLDGAAALSRSTILRLTRLAHDRQVVFLLAGDAESASPTVGASVRLGLRLESDERKKVSRQWRTTASIPQSIQLVRSIAEPSPDTPASIDRQGETRLAITVAKGGPPTTMRVPYTITSPRRLGCHAEVPDRRGVARVARSSKTASTADCPRTPGVRSAGSLPVARQIGRVDRSPHARRAGESSYGRR